MPITWEIDKEVQTGLSRKSVFVRLTGADGNDFKLFEATAVPLNIDPDEYIESHPSLTARKMWNRGKPITVSDVRGARCRKMRAYYRHILDEIEETAEAGSSLDTALTAAMQAVAQNGRGEAAFAKRREWLELENPDTIEEKRTLLLTIENFALRGLTQ